MTDSERSMKLPEGRVSTFGAGASGQSIVLIILLIVGLVALAGIATDVGFLFARSSQFTAAVDAAALAGVVDLPAGLDTAIERSTEFLVANWPEMSEAAISGAESMTGQGYPEYILTATLPVETYFLRIVGFGEIPVTRSAGAALYTQADMPTATQSALGVTRIAGQFVMGPDSCTAQGDPISATWIAPGQRNPLRHLTGGRYVYRIQIPADFPAPLEVQLFDPDSLNQNAGFEATVTRADGSAEPRTCPSRGNGDTCLMITGDDERGNPVWLWRVDETWGPYGAGCPGRQVSNPNGNTVTQYRLYYIGENDEQEEIATFTTGPATDSLTDMKWVTPGKTAGIGLSSGSSFLIGGGLLDSLPTDSRGNRSVYLGVSAIAGTSKNGWDLWAGPASIADRLPAGGNERNLAILDDPAGLGTGGVEIFAQGYLPVTSYFFVSDVTLPLAAVSRAEGGGALYGTVFDFDEDASGPIQFGFSTMDLEDRPAALAAPRSPSCPGGNCDNGWVEPPFDIPIPSNNPADHGVGPGTPCPPTICAPFYGGHLTAGYTIGLDEQVWSISLHGGRPFLTR